MKLRQYLEEHCISISKLSEKSCITRMTIYNIINGVHKYKVNAYTKEQLANALGITIKQLEELL